MYKPRHQRHHGKASRHGRGNILCLLMAVVVFVLLIKLTYSRNETQIVRRDAQATEDELYHQITELEDSLMKAEAPVYTINHMSDLGEFKITFYSLDVECCGKTADDPAYGITKSGAHVREGVTVAVDPKVIPLGSYIYIEGLGYYVAQDTGSAVKGNVIDVYVDDIQTGYNLGGKLTKNVYMMEG
jgi:3D (Asp-Asp-Asp) domain-containing protein